MPKKDSGIGQALAIIVIVALALGGLYYLSMSFSGTEVESLPTVQDLQNSNDPDVSAIMTQSSSDSLSDIDADVSATNLGAVDAAVTDLNTNLQSQ
jgi:hypothetical protein